MTERTATMSIKEIAERLKKAKVGEQETLPVCAVLFFAALGLSFVMTLALRACAQAVAGMAGGAA